MRIYRILIVIFFGILFAKDSNILLLKPFDKNMVNDSNIKEFLVSEKLDGVRAIWDGKILKTRNNNVINAPKCFTQGFPNFTLDGELWIARGKFSEIASIVKLQDSNCKDWENVKYYIFDVPYAKCNNNDKKLCNMQYSLESRLKILQDYLSKNNVKNLQIIKQERLDSIKELESRLDSITKAGGEGLVVRKNAAPYEAFRSNNAFKLKKFQDSECKVKGITQGKGKFEGKMGALICAQSLESFAPHTHPRLNASNKNEEIEFKIGSGFDTKMRENPPKIGTIITYKFQGFSKNGLPRFPVFLRIHEGR